MIRKNFKNAFTLAEVLITLGIIGVVAAMTMPTLLNSTQGAQYRTAYKKALSVLSQAVVLNVALDDYDLGQATAGGTSTTSPSLYALIKNRMNVVSENTGTTTGEGWDTDDDNVKFGSKASGNYTFFFNDGIVLSFKKDAGRCVTPKDELHQVAGEVTGEGPIFGGTDGHCLGVIDVNGSKNPNEVIACDSGTEGSGCQVKNPTDIYPIMMYNQTILPATDAGRAVLYGGK